MRVHFSIRRLFSAIPCLLIFVLLTSLSASAADICCGCNPSGANPTPKQSCFIFSDSQLANPSNCTTVKDPSILNGMTCDQAPLSATQCASVAKNGICKDEPTKTGAAVVGEIVTSGASTEAPVPTLLNQALQFNTPIPGFTSPNDMGLLFATYVVAIYRYMISIGIFITTVMFIWGAFRYLVGSGVGGVARGKAIMKDAVVGLLLVLSANLILRTINPELVSLQNLNLAEVQSKLWQPVDIAFNVPVGSKSALKTAVIQQAKATGIPEIPCMAKATIDRESGGNLGAINHNEDFNSAAYAVKSRQLYLSTGGGGKFSPIPCSSAACQVQSVPKNGDKLDLNSPPNYGLDLKYSHALGAAQAAIFPNDKPCPGKEGMGPGHRETAGGKSVCLTIPELMSADGAAAVIVMQSIRNLKSYPNNIAQALGRYVGNLTADHPESQARYAIFQACMSRGIDSYPDYNGSMVSASAGGKSKGGGGIVTNGTKILLIGDSLSVGLKGPLGGMLQNAGSNFTSVTKEGMTMQAFDTGQMSAAFNEALRAKPQYVLVSLGTNDEYQKNYLGTAQKSMNSIISKIKAAGADIYWIGPPSLPATYNNNHPSGQILPILRQSANYYESANLTIPRGDGLHPTGQGYKMWAQEIFNWLTK